MARTVVSHVLMVEIQLLGGFDSWMIGTHYGTPNDPESPFSTTQWSKIEKNLRFFFSKKSISSPFLFLLCIPLQSMCGNDQ